MLKSYSRSILIFPELYQSKRKIKKILRIIATTALIFCISTANAKTGTGITSSTNKRYLFGDGKIGFKAKKENVNEDKNKKERR
jgi:hypothetical protein